MKFVDLPGVEVDLSRPQTYSLLRGLVLDGVPNRKNKLIHIGTIESQSDMDWLSNSLAEMVRVGFIREVRLFVRPKQIGKFPRDIYIGKFGTGKPPGSGFVLKHTFE